VALKLTERITLDVSEESSKDVTLESGYLGALWIQAAADTTVTVSVEKSGGTVIFSDTLDVSVQDSHFIPFVGGLSIPQSGTADERSRLRHDFNLGYGARINVAATADADIFVYEWY